MCLHKCACTNANIYLFKCANLKIEIKFLCLLLKNKQFKQIPLQAIDLLRKTIKFCVTF